MNKKTIAIILALVAVGVMIYWYASGANMFTQTKVPVEVTDELFNTTHTEWRPGYRPGLEVLGPIAGVLLLAAGWFGWSASRDKRRPGIAS